MHRYPIKTAAHLAKASYKAETHPSVAPHLANTFRQGNDLQAHFLSNGVLLIPGTNSVRDWISVNLRIFNIGNTQYRLNDTTTAKGASGTLWHQGFLAHARAIWDWMQAHDQKPKYIIGHSLGAAAAQILTKSYGVYGIGFAAPRPRKHRGAIVNGDRCLCINRDDDTVCALPTSFHHLGKVHRCKAKGSNFGPDHHMKHYRKVVDEQIAAGLLPEKWPAQA